MSAFDTLRTFRDCARLSIDGWGLIDSLRWRRIGCGALPCRQSCSLAYLGPDFPYGTLMVNVIGGLLAGVLAQLFVVKGDGSQEFRLFLTTGFLSGFTIFSAFSLDAAMMLQRSNYAALASYILASVLHSIAALFVGMAAVRSLTWGRDC